MSKKLYEGEIEATVTGFDITDVTCPNSLCKLDVAAVNQLGK
jgi:hypothetical protein